MLVSLCKKKENRSFVWWFCKDWSQGTRGHPIDVYFAMSSLKLPPQSLSSVALRAPTSVAETNYFLQCVGGKVYFVFISSFPNHFSVQSPHYSTATDAKRNKGFFLGGGGDPILFNCFHYEVFFLFVFFFNLGCVIFNDVPLCPAVASWPCWGRVGPLDILSDLGWFLFYFSEPVLIGRTAFMPNQRFIVVTTADTIWHSLLVRLVWEVSVIS